MRELPDLSSEELAEIRRELDEFSDRVYWLAQQVPPGEVVTYGQLALYAGSPRAARAVGTLMRNSLSNGVEVPWQRVINASGGISFKGDYARAELQRRLLEDEGVVFDSNTKCDLKRFRWEPDVLFWEDDE
ncbi:cysteine methyltransferase [Persicimonas caeni]|uniref:Cysteine methyltransferase n=1 Tax=Persicimonas caeni TaxID=2292766 RepID=A0A4Y6Q1F9_PERCE|nr:MGMT family protein [Persicimonas caeni]QDG54421.1 cysteine methyltransferase [Persicimonas caeni]QED35642.1 cysteine methyltransferase [Persicimonas caeni]